MGFVNMVSKATGVFYLNKAVGLMDGRLFEAAAKGDEKTVAACLDLGGVDGGAAHSRGGFALIAAAQGGHCGVVRVMAKAGCEINARAQLGATALTEAIKECHKEAVAAILECGGDPNLPGKGEACNTPLAHAAVIENKDDAVEIGKMLLDAGAKADAVEGFERRAPLLMAVKKGNFGFVKMLLESGVGVFEKDENGGFEGSLALEEALRARRGGGAGARMVGALAMEVLGSGDSNGRHLVDRALMWLVGAGEGALARGLLENGAQVDGRSGPKGMTALMDATENDVLALMGMLLDNGADPNAASGDTGAVALNFARSPDAAKLLLARGAAVEGANGSKAGTPLFEAVDCGRAGVARVLLEAGADPNVAKGGWTALTEAARSRSKPSLVPDLLRAGANANGRSKGGETALMLASARGDAEAAEALLAAGARVGDENEDGDTAELLARKAGHAALADRLSLLMTRRERFTVVRNGMQAVRGFSAESGKAFISKDGLDEKSKNELDCSERGDELEVEFLGSKVKGVENLTAQEDEESMGLRESGGLLSKRRRV